MFGYVNQGEHRYSLAATGVKFKDQEFTSRQVAEKAMYKFIDKHYLKVNQIYNDKHDKTYICDNGIRFYISRI